MKKFALILCLLSSIALFAADKPNVVLIFIDDMGYGDVGFNGATVPKTPNLDQMAAEGMKFTDFYVGCAVCSGSRTALMTGAHYQRLSMNAVLFPNSTKGLHPDEVTLADMLKGAGYDTACVGKWHLGHLPPCLPTYQGFDSYWGIPYSNDMWIDPANKLADNIVIRKGLTLDEVKAGHKLRNEVPIFHNEEVVEYPADQSTITKRYTEKAIEFITQERDEPFFLYLPHTMVHLPLFVSKAFDNPDKTLITNAIEEVDWSVGEILKTLKEAGISENTLVIFTSDNGAAVGSSLPLRAKKGSVYDGGIREPTLMWWPGKIPAGKVCSEVAASIDMMPTLVELSGGEMPEAKIDGKNIWPLIAGEDGAKSPHEAYVLPHGPGTVRSGKWKFYPWPEGKGKGDWSTKNKTKGQTFSTFPVQLYDTVADIGETKNVAEANPEIVARLQKSYDTFVADLKANQRPTADMIRPEGAISPDRPGQKKKAAGNKTKSTPINWKTAKAGDAFQSSVAPQIANKPFTISCSIEGINPDGVIVAHGGSEVGYTLYSLNGGITFMIRQSGTSIARVTNRLESSRNEIVASIKKDGSMQVSVNGKAPLVGRAPQLKVLAKQPQEDFCIGHDNKNPVDTRAPAEPFAGTISKLKVTVD